VSFSADGVVTCVSFSADGALVASGSSDGLIHVWDATTRALLRTIPHANNENGVRDVQFSPTTSRMVATASWRRITLFDVDSGEAVEMFEGCNFAAFAPDGRTIATKSFDYHGDVWLVDVELGEIWWGLAAHAQGVSSAAFSDDDGNKLATVGYDSTCKVWGTCKEGDSSTGELLRTIELGQGLTTMSRGSQPSHLVSHLVAQGPMRVAASVSWGRDWVRATQAGVAFAMGHHPRLGGGSPVLELEAGVVRMILDRV